MVAEERKAPGGTCDSWVHRWTQTIGRVGSSHLIALWTKLPPHRRGLFLTATICLGRRGPWGYWSLLSGGKCGVGGRGTFRRRDAQLSSVTRLSQLQIFLMGHVLLLPRMALVPQGKVGRPHQNRPQNLGGSSSIPEPREVALLSLSGCELCCHLWMPEHHQHSRPSTSSTLLTSPLPTASQSPSSLFFHPVPLCHLMPCCHLLSPAPSLPRQPLTPLPAPPCFHISGLPTLPPHHLFFHAWTFTPITAGNPQAQPGSWSPIFPLHPSLPTQPLPPLRNNKSCRSLCLSGNSISSQFQASSHIFLQIPI